MGKAMEIRGAALQMLFISQGSLHMHEAQGALYCMLGHSWSLRASTILPDSEGSFLLAQKTGLYSALWKPTEEAAGLPSPFGPHAASTELDNGNRKHYGKTRITCGGME